MVATVVMVVMTATETMIMVPMMTETLQILIDTACVSLQHQHRPHLSLILVTSPVLFPEELTLGSFLRKTHLKLSCQIFFISFTVLTIPMVLLIIEKNPSIVNRLDGGSTDKKWDSHKERTYRSFRLTLKNQAEVAGFG